MSFRRNSDRSLSWRRWIDLHRDQLTAAGVPTEIFSDELRWWRFVEEGGLDYVTGWRVEMLSPSQAEILHRLVTKEYERPDLVGILRSLDDVRFSSKTSNDDRFN